MTLIKFSKCKCICIEDNRVLSHIEATVVCARASLRRTCVAKDRQNKSTAQYFYQIAICELIKKNWSKLLTVENVASFAAKKVQQKSPNDKNSNPTLGTIPSPVPFSSWTEQISFKLSHGLIENNDHRRLGNTARLHPFCVLLFFPLQ